MHGGLSERESPKVENGRPTTTGDRPADLFRFRPVEVFNFQPVLTTRRNARMATPEAKCNQHEK
jgi:hypothetical protein